MDEGLWSSGDVGEFLSISTPSVRRAARVVGVEPVLTAGGHRRFTPDQVRRIAGRTGIVPRVDGLTRQEVQVLAAIARHPFGLDSARAVARAASTSPTVSARVLPALEQRGFIRHAASTVIHAGSAREGTRWHLVLGPPWFRIAAQVSATILPAGEVGAPPARVPARFWHLFWNADPAALSIEHNADYIATRLVLGPDLAARSWALHHLPVASLAKAASNRGAGPALRAMVSNAIRS